MSIRMKTFVIMLSVCLFFTVANLGMGLIFTQEQLAESIQSDMGTVADIANMLVSREITLLKAEANVVAQTILRQSLAWTAKQEASRNMNDALAEQAVLYENFLGLAIVDPYGVHAFAGTPPSTAELKDSIHVQAALQGTPTISTSRIDSNGQLVFYVCVPMGDRVLTATVSGMHFCKLLSERFRIFETGNIFLLDSEGIALADMRSDSVQSRLNFLDAIQTDPRATDKQRREVSEIYEEMASGQPGFGYFEIEGERRFCTFRPVENTSVEKWTLGVSVPLAENPANQVGNALLLSSIIFFLAGVLMSIFVSRFFTRPLEKIEEQNGELARLATIARNASETKTNFLANMSHEMRTPLNAVVGFSELMLAQNSDDEDDEGAQNMKRIYNAGMTLLGIVNDILDISKIEAGKFELIPVEYDMPSLINDIVAFNLTRIGEKPIRFNLHVDPALPGMILGDEMRTKQIFNNLLSNAFKYTQEGNVDWNLSFEREGDSVWLISSVHDTGIGIREKDLQKLFSSYNQVDVKSNRKIEGTGLGLSITKRLVEMMDGEIRAESEYGKGSTFSIRIRQQFVSDRPIGKKLADTLQSQHYFDSRRVHSANLVRIQMPYARVLFVDDMPVNLEVAKGMAKPYGMQVDCVASGPAAIQRIRAGEPRYSAIFMDHMMPDMDGIEAARVIREEIGTEYARTVPIIALTANALAGNEEMFLQRGFQAFLSKPIDVMLLDAVIRQWVRDKKLEAEYERAQAKDQRETQQADQQADQQEAQTPAQDQAEERAPRSGGELRQKGEEHAYDADTAEQGTAPLRVEGINMRKALSFLGDDEESLVMVLYAYLDSIPPVLDQIREIGEGGLPAYAIAVHGIKGSSRSICAEALGAQAEALEYAAKAGDMTFVRENNGPFIQAAEKLIAALRAALPEDNGLNL